MESNLEQYQSEINERFSELENNNIIKRIWLKDHTVWKPEPDEIINRLGWLDITDFMQKQVSTLESFSDHIRNSGYNHVLLLGMGGSSLGAKVLNQIFGNTAGYPELLVLDSTMPDCIQDITDKIDLLKTLFIVSSKSSTTIETLSLFQYFYHLIASSTSKNKAGQHFITITDPETALSRIVLRENFLHTFLNPTDIGGRYSVLSYFGLVPAALTGINIRALLDASSSMQEMCSPDISIPKNPGAWLGIIIGTLALNDRDKLTIITSPGISNLGLWIEQLVAESTGKEGKGIIPIIGEPVIEPEYYDNDRIFIYLRLNSDNNLATDEQIHNIKTSGQPVSVLELQDRYDIAAEFYRWEFAIAVTGAILGINPFEQSGVSLAKIATQEILYNYTLSGNLPTIDIDTSLADLINNANPGDYLVILAYINQSSETDRVFSEFREYITKKYNLATTLGYGPRYLHSTGQLHKGGPDKGVFLFITSDRDSDIPVPDMPYTFGTLADAQALGDMQVLQSMGKRVSRLRLSKPDTVQLADLMGNI